MSIAFFDKVRQDKRDEQVEQLIVSTYDRLLSKVAAMPASDSYETDLPVDLLDDATAKVILAKIEEKLLHEDVKTSFSYDSKSKILTVNLDAIPTPSTERSSIKYFWSRAPGKFVNKVTGQAVTLSSSLSVGPSFTGTVRDWYETLVETIIDVSNGMHRQHGTAPNKVFVGADVHTILECSCLYKPRFNSEDSPASLCTGTLTNRFRVYKREDVPKNEIFVCLDLGDTRYVDKVEVLDMNII